MSFTAELGTSLSMPGNIALGYIPRDLAKGAASATDAGVGSATATDTGVGMTTATDAGIGNASGADS